MKKILFILVFICFSLGYGQNTGDYRSFGSGPWNSSATWHIYNGTTWVNPPAGNYPGNPGGNYAVTILSGHNVSVNSNLTITTGNVTIQGTLTLNANLKLSGLSQFIIDHGVVFFKKGTELTLPQNTELIIDINSSANPSQGMHPLNYDNNECNNNTALYIGLIKYAACTGGGNTAAGTFSEVNVVGGSILAAPFASPIAVCLSDNQPVTLLGSVIRSLPSLTPAYSWQLISKPPAATFVMPTTNTQNVSIGTLTQAGDYVFELTVTAEFKSRTLTSIKRVTISVDGTTTFNGTTWSNDIPSAQNHRHAVISSPYVTGLQGGFSACSCTVNAGQKLTVTGGTSVNLVGKLTNNGAADNVVIESDGNLLQKLNVANTGDVTVQRSVTDMDNVLGTAMDYVYWSAPVTGQALQAFSPGTPANRIYQYNEATDFFTPASGSFVLGKGYAIQAETSAGFPPNATGYDKTYEFKGVPNNGNVPVSLKRSVNTGAGGSVVHGYNLIGNPYPSNINFDVLFANNSGLIYNTAWFWTNKTYTQNQQGQGYAGNNYAVYNGTGGNNAPNPGGIAVGSNVIKVGQGFMVQVRTGPNTSGNLNFQNFWGSQNLRVADAGTFYQKGDTGKDRFWLELVSPEGQVNSQLIGYVDGSTKDYEQDYDAEIMNLSSDIFYSTVDDKKLLIQGKGVFSVNDRVNLGANFFSEGSYSVALKHPEGIFAGGQDLWLKDAEKGIMINLSKEKSYRFTAKKGESTGRFQILYQNLGFAGSDGQSPDEMVKVYKDGGDFIVKSNKNIDSLELFEVSGRLVYRSTPDSPQVTVSGAQLNPGIYILKIFQNGKVTTKKVLR